jgi:hypothetical protein
MTTTPNDTTPVSPSNWPTSNTEHGMLVAFGEFLRQHGVIDDLRQVPIKQRVRQFTPQEKLIEFLAGIMSGIEHLKDLNEGPRPLARDPWVAHAWGQAGFAHYSSISRTLDCCDDQTVHAVEHAIQAFSRPFIAQAIEELLRRGIPITYDLDLLGQTVSATSQTYPYARFGWMDDGVHLGYQLARVCLTGHDGMRHWLAGFHHPGDTVSVNCVKELSLASEAQTGIRPRRRTELVAQRVQALADDCARLRRLAAQQNVKLETLRATQERLIGQRYHAEQECLRPLSAYKLGVLRQQLASWSKRLPRLAKQIADAQRILADHQARLAKQEAACAALQQWQAQLERENQLNPDAPPLIEIRMDAGCCSGENLTWLLEMGYSPVTKAPNDQTTQALRQRVSLTPDTHWVRVGDNAEMVAWSDYQLHDCPYPLTVALERFKVGREREYKYATLVLYRDDGLLPTSPAWFDHYNHRQLIEAGNKEMTGTFFIQHLMSRSWAGIRLQVLFTGLAANVVHWCPAWLKSCAASVTPQLNQTLKSPKRLVRVAANAPALVQRTEDGASLALRFAPHTALSGVTLFLKGVPAFQLALGFQRPQKFASG